MDDSNPYFPPRAHDPDERSTGRGCSPFEALNGCLFGFAGGIFGVFAGSLWVTMVLSIVGSRRRGAESDFVFGMLNLGSLFGAIAGALGGLYYGFRITRQMRDDSRPADERGEPPVDRPART